MSRAHQLACLILAGSYWTVLSFSMNVDCNLGRRIRASQHDSNVGEHEHGLKRISLHATQEPSGEKLREEAERLLQRAKELRAELPEEDLETVERASTKTAKKPWAVETTDSPGVGYRLYVDIGREEGTWMDPRWGASGNRIEFTLDVRFLTGGDEAFADKSVQENMVTDNFGGKSSRVSVVRSADNARLRNGFDSMSCHGGGYRIDANKNAGTVRFYILVDGTPETGSSYGDVSVPKGCLYFSLPCFGNSVSNLSTKEGIVSVRQIGWHTGWRREESRISGVFRAVPVETASKRDGF